MAGQISEQYASPNLRLGLLLEDHPSATYTFELIPGERLGIPAEFGGGGNFCVATIFFPDGRQPVSAWKPVPARGDADQWNILCTKTLGRALKRAGYPDDLDDLKALVVWRKRNTEIRAIDGGTAPVQWAIGAGGDDRPDPVVLAIAAAATDSPDGRPGGDDGMGDIPAELVADIRELVEGLDANDEALYADYLRSIGAPTDPAKMTAGQADDVLAWLEGPAD